MRVLLLGPDHELGSIPPYLAVLAQAFRDIGITVDRLGSPGLPYDLDTHRFWPVEDILHAAQNLLAQVDLDAYDLLALHSGNLEVEQLLPILWSNQSHPPVVYHVHTLAPTLFTEHIPDPRIQHAVFEGLHEVDGIAYFGYHAAESFCSSDPTTPSTVSWLPTTIPPGTPAKVTRELQSALTKPDEIPLISLYGYAAPWKDPALLLAAAEQLDKPLRIVLAGPGWDDNERAGIYLPARRFGLNNQVEVVVVPNYVEAAHRRALVAATDLAVFPYKAHPSFQGSGAIADYLAHGVPVLATDVANMAELIADAGSIAPTNSPDILATEIDRLTTGTASRARVRSAAQRRAKFFTAHHHARQCLNLYERVIKRTQTGTRS